MEIKQRFSLISNRMGNVYNILPIDSRILIPMEIEEEDYKHMEIIFGAYIRSRNISNINLNTKHIKDIMVVRYEDYPLPGFVTRDGKAVVNLAPIDANFISDISSVDITALYLYALALKIFIDRRNLFDKHIDEHISEYIILIIMNLFAKKHGLTGSYKDLIPQLQALVYIYVATGFMGTRLDSKLLQSASNKFMVDVNEIQIDNNIDDIIGLFKSIRKNNIISISENVFANSLTNRAGISSLPLFEDGARFFATIIASSVSGNSIFSSYFKKVNKQAYDRLYYLGTNAMRRGL